MNSEFLPKKRVLIFYGSPHKNGATSILLEQFIKALPQGTQVDRISAFESNIVPCVDCGMCRDRDGCAFDDFDNVDRLYRKADAIVVATPIYNLSFPAPLKGIFDRTQQYFNTRFYRGINPPISKPKKAAMLLTCGADSEDGAVIIKRQLDMIFSVMNTKLVAHALWKDTDRNPEKYGEQALEDAMAAAKKICA